MTSPFAQRHSQSRLRTSRRAGNGFNGWMIGWMVLGLLAMVPASAWAAPQPEIDLHWEAPQGCPQEGDVREKIQNLLGSTRQASHLRAEGTIAKLDRRYRLDLVVRVRDLAGTRTIESNACEDLAGAAAVEIALLVHSAESSSDPGRTGKQPRTSTPVHGSEPSTSSQGTNDASASGRTLNGAKPESKPEIAKDVAKEIAKEEEKQPKQEEPVEESPRARHVMVQLPILDLGLGPLPRSTRGIGLALGLEYANWQLQVEGVAWQRQSVPAPGYPGYGADVDRMGAAIWGCREFRGAWLGISPCLTVGLDRVSGTGTGRNVVQSSQSAFGMTAGAGVQGRVYITRWIRLLLAVGGHIELSRPQISVAGGKPGDNLEPYQFDVYQFAPAALTVAIGLEWML